jgi:hypothetical protein
LWKYLAVGAFIAVLGEVAATRWIALSRKSTTSEKVDFAVRAASAPSYAETWARMRDEADAARTA